MQMAARITALESVDPLAVPLPHGTEVTTRVPRALGNRQIPQGLIGRVVREREGGFDLHIAGVGEVWYRREEIAPRRAGQLSFAVRRAAAWQALQPCKIIEATVGSRAWGLAHDASDTDLRGTFVLPFPWTVGLVEAPRDLVSADGSQTFWEAAKTVEQALRADPNTLELLFVPSVKPLDEMGEWLLEERDAFVSQLIFGSFGRYALSQLDKLAKSQRLAEHRDLVLGWLSENHDISLDEVALRLSQISPREFPGEKDAILAAKTYIKQLYRSLADQGLLEANDFAALKRYAIDGGRRPPEARSLRPKNAYNLLRLMALASGWLKTGEPMFEATGAFRDRLLEIKEGRVALDEVLRQAEAMSPELEQARERSPLPEAPDVVRAHRLIRRVGEESARRWVSKTTGAWGMQAPVPPEPNQRDS
ncbi:MAG: nucleotidyltransferase domain-containing protein [Myxococcaceae bacterium]|nr:nucleotidyltransferase domain-containing protein [Myxococcaceae bacterium]